MVKRYKISRRFLIFWTLFIGIGAVAGAVCMLIKPDGTILGMQTMLPYFQVLPFADVLFQNFVFSGIALLVVNGITNLTSAVLLIKNKKSGVITGTLFGITLMLWIIIQFVIFPVNFMSTSFFIFGFLQFLTGYICYVGYKQKEFSFNATEYKNICKNKTKLVVYFSRMGYTKKIAYQTADREHADIYELKTTERINGDLGFLWCGRFAMHRWGMNIENIPDIEKYEKIIICSPVWDFGICSPIIEFCKKAKGKIKSFDLVSVHFLKAGYKYLPKKVSTYLGIDCEKYESYSSHFGKFTKIL